MAYKGTRVPIAMGQGGLHTDDPPSSIPPTSYTDAINVSVFKNVIQKSPGSLRFNLTQIPGGIYAAYDWWPTTSSTNRRLCVVGGNGKVYFITDSGIATEVTCSDASAATLSVSNQIHFVAGGNEVGGATRKLFIMDGASPVQFIDGTATTRAAISDPDAAWTAGNTPYFGFIMHGRLTVFANSNPHAIQFSDSGDHQKFTGMDSYYFNVFPGEAERLTSGFTIGGRLYMLKYPDKAYNMIDTDANPANWYVQRASGSLGAASAHSAIIALNDALIKTASDSVVSVLTVKEFGDIKAGDTYNILRIEQFVRDNCSPAGAIQTHAIYYADKKIAMFTHRSTNSIINDRIMEFRLDTANPPKATFNTKDKANCLALRKDAKGILRPIYGSLDGFIYLMDQTNFDVNGTPYISSFQTPALDFGFMPRALGQPNPIERNKNFDFLEIRAAPLGNWNLYVDTYIDDLYYETVTIALSGDALLADVPIASTDFQLASSTNDITGSFLSAGEDYSFFRVPIHGTGRTISFKFYDDHNGQGFQIATIFVGYRLSGDQNK